MGNRSILEWYDRNMCVNYPLVGTVNTPDEQVGRAVGGTWLPQSFLVDVSIDADSRLGLDAQYGFFVHRVYPVGMDMVVEIAYMKDGTVYPCLRSAAIPKSLQSTDDLVSRRTIGLANVVAAESGVDMPTGLDATRGTLVVGTCQDMQDIGALSFTYDTGMLMPARVHSMPSRNTEITVKSSDGVVHTLSGDFSLIAGDGIDLIVDDYKSTVTIAQAAMGDVESSIRSVDELVSEVRRRIGYPICHINGVGPDDRGNLNLVGADCVKVESAQNGVVLSNPCATPCCNETTASTSLEKSMDNAEMEIQRLEAYYTALTSTVGIMQARLASLISARTRNGV